MTQQRDADFTAKLEKIAASLSLRGIHPTPDEVISAALISRPRQYYLSYAYIVRRLSSLRKNGFFDRPRAVAPGAPKAIWYEIEAKVRVYLQRHRRATIDEAVSHLLNFGAPERFYMSLATARRIFNRRFHKEIAYK